MNRRQFLQLAAAVGLALPGQANALLPTPDLNRQGLIRLVAGLRPYRRGSVRLEAELGDPLLVHNYGHGGSGFTLSWGCAQEVLEMIGSREGSVAVVGAGAIGPS